VRRWMRGLRRSAEVSQKPMQPVSLAEGIELLPGLWVAVLQGQVVEAGRTPDQVVESLHRRNIRGAAIVRMPSERDVELVGLG